MDHLLNCGDDWDPDTFVLQLDFENAFNLVSRTVLFAEVREHCPSIAAWVEYCYRDAAYMFLQGHNLFSREGVQQGDPLGSLEFSLVLQKFVLHVKEECPDLRLNVWYLDDGTLVGKKADLLKVLRLAITEGPKYGLHLNLSKSLVWSPLCTADFSGFPADLPTKADGGIKLLGSMAATDSCAEVIDSYACKRVDKIAAMVDSLDLLDDVQLQYILLKYCVAMPRFNFQLRVANPDHIPVAIAQFDDVLRTAVESLMGNCQLSAVDMTRMSLPVTMSGFGMPLARTTALPAHIASRLSSLTLQMRLLRHGDEDLLLHRVRPLVATFNSLLPEDQHVTIDKIRAAHESQHMLSSLVNKVELANLIARIETPRDRHVIQACLRDSGAWLEVFPNPAFGMVLNAREWRACARFRLGKPIFSEPTRCPCCNNATMDIYGIHATYCQAEGDCIARHNMVRDAIFDAAREGHLQVERERGFLLSDDVSGEKPADILIHNWRHAQDLCVDVCIANSLEYSSLNREFDPMEPLNNKENIKNAKYGPSCASRGLIFKPFVCGSLGGLNEDAISIIKVIGKAIAAAQGIHRSITIDRLRKRISFAVQKAQATSWLRRGAIGDVLLS
jgi:hypothetical protein